MNIVGRGMVLLAAFVGLTPVLGEDRAQTLEAIAKAKKSVATQLQQQAKLAYGAGKFEDALHTYQQIVELDSDGDLGAEAKKIIPRLMKEVEALRVVSRLKRLGLVLKEHAGGVGVVSVDPGSPAAEAAMHPGDLLVTVEKVKALSIKAVDEEVFHFAPGQRIKVTVQRPEAQMTLATLWLTVPDLAPPRPVYGSPAHSDLNQKFRLPATTEEQETQRRLGTIRSAVSIYYGTHEGRYPARLDDESFVGPNEKRVPLKVMPSDALIGSSRVQITKGNFSKASESGDGQGGWLYNPASGEVWVNLKGQDSRGVPFTHY